MIYYNKYFQAKKDTEYTNKRDYYLVTQLYKGEIAIQTQKVINQGNIFVKESDEIFDLSQGFDANNKYQFLVSDREIPMGEIKFVNKEHLKQILIEKMNFPFNNGLNKNNVVIKNITGLKKGYPCGFKKFVAFKKNSDKKHKVDEFLLFPI